MNEINKLLFSRWVCDSVKISTIPQLSNFDSLPDVSEATKSVYSRWFCSIKNNVVSALFKIASMKQKQGGCFGSFKDQNGTRCFYIEMPYKNAVEYAVIRKGNLYVCKMVAGKKQSYVFKEGYDNGVLMIVAQMLYEIFVQYSDKEFSDNVDAILELIESGINDNNIQKFTNIAAIISTNMYQRMIYQQHPEVDLGLLDEFGNARRLLKIPTNIDIVIGESKQVQDESFSLNKKTEPTITREWSDYEKQLIPEIPSWYIMPKEVPEICKLFHSTSNTVKPKRNFMFRGPSSTGKTSMARAIAGTLKMPYVYITCNADTESYDFLGQPMYDTDGNIKYIESNFIKAIRNGWVVEIQEPYVIAKQGVLTALNGLLDDTGGITLSNGEFVKRHPDAVIIFTTNVSYVGCKKPNQSVLRRMNNVYDIDTPTSSEILERVKSVTKFDNEKILVKMIDCFFKINAKLKEECIEDGVCGVSEMIDWVSTAQVTGDIIESAKSTIISKATDETEDQLGLLSLIEASFSVEESSLEEFDKFIS